MTSICACLYFNGNCLEAMKFYQKCLGGKLIVQHVKDVPVKINLPKKMKNIILHSTLINDSIFLMGTDLIDDSLVKGNSISLMIDCNSESEIKSVFKNLSDGGSKRFPLQKNFEGAMYGNLTDKFGQPWILHYRNSKKK
jgi:PhnB protein